MFSDSSKLNVDIKVVMKYFGIEIIDNKCLCPFHDDKNPSMLVNNSFAYCFACSRGWDTYDFLMEYLDCDFDKVHALLQNSDFPKATSSSRKSKYVGPVPRSLVDYWHTCLVSPYRHVLYEQRLLNDETIDKNLIGWRPDYGGFVLPFWLGEPQKSEIEIVQFRVDPDKFKSKYIGLKGHNKPSIINRHLLKSWGVMLFGTFDSYLAGQDGLPCISPNGCSRFATKRYKKELIEILKDVKKLYVVYDATESERKSAQKTVADLPCEVIEREFKEPYKDYNDYRLEHSFESFMEEILEWRMS